MEGEMNHARQDDFLSLSKMNFGLSEEQSLVLDQVDRACKGIRPIEDKCYLQHRFNDRVGPAFGQAHLLGLPISKSFGDGQGADNVTYALAIERIGREGTGVRTFVSAHVSLGELTVQKWGSEEQKGRYLPRTTKGEKVMAFGLTEPGAGSDPASLKTSFEESGGKFILSGQKTWISNGSIADLVIIFAYPRGKSDGMCAFLVERGTAGFSAKPIENKMGLPTSDTGTIYLEKCENPKNEQSRDAADLEIAKAKYFAANASFDAANRAVQVFGANGYSLENRPARHLLDTRVTKIYEGTDEILEQKIALGVLGKAFEAYS